METRSEQSDQDLHCLPTLPSNFSNKLKNIPIFRIIMVMHFLHDIKNATEYAYHYLLLPPPGVCGCMPFNNCLVLRPTSAMPSMTGQFKHLGLTDAIMNLSP